MNLCSRITAVRGLGGLAALMIMMSVAGAGASEPVAIVEDISRDRDDLQFMDLLERGRSFELSRDETVTLGYLASCARETIRGGRVLIGAEQSRVFGGAIERDTVRCDNRSHQLAEAQSQEVGASIFRNAFDRPVVPGQSADDATPPRNFRRLYAPQPLVKLRSASVARITVRRLDRPAEPIRLWVRDGVVDFRVRDVTLAVGGLYRVEAGSASVVFRILPAQRGADTGTALSRLILL